MNKLNELIHALCPNGVRYQKLSDVARIERGKRVVREQLSSENGFPVFQNSLTPMGYHTDYNYEGETTYVIGAGAAGEIGYSTERFWAADDCFPIVSDREVHSRYIFHVLKWQQKFLKSKVRKASIPRLARDIISNLIIPVPPLPVQDELVRVLDNLTELSAELTTELTAELTTRKMQYEHYRDEVFAAQSCAFLQIKEIATTNIGLATSVTKYKTDIGVLLLHNSDIQQNRIVLKQYEYISEEFAQKNAKKILQKDDIITVHTGDVGTSAVIDGVYIGAIGFTTITTRIKDKSKVLPQYLCHYLNSHRCKMDIASMTISDRNNLNQSSFENLVIPVPTLEEQRRIVEILERLDLICNDLSAALPTEIEARQKQYEYYRDKLLTFEELKENVG